MSRDGKIIPVNVKVRLRGTSRVPLHPRCSSRLMLLLLLLLQAGDRVLLPEYGGHAVKIGDDEFSLYRCVRHP